MSGPIACSTFLFSLDAHAREPLWESAHLDTGPSVECIASQLGAIEFSQEALTNPFGAAASVLYS